MITDMLKKIGIPAAYGTFHTKQEPPFIVWLGDGQDHFFADNEIYLATADYRLEYYFLKKDEEAEQRIEDVLTEEGYIYEKSEDIYIESEDFFSIYFSIWRK